MTLPTLPQEALIDLRQARAERNLVWQGDQESIPGECPNCGGAHILVFTFQTGGPYKSIITTKDGAHYDPSTQNWYTTETKTYNCPMCYDPKAQRNQLWVQSGTDLVTRGWSMDYYKGMDGKETAVKACNQMMQRPVQGLLTLFGTYGTGKTAMMKIMVAWMINHDIRARYMTANEILVEIKSSFGDRTVSEAELLNMYKSYTFLAIDEVDRVSNTEWSLATLFSVLDIRYAQRSKIATVLATNQHPEKMGEQWGYLMSRMKDGLRIHVGGKELRGQR